MITMTEIAKLAHVSQPTVSRVLNGNMNVAPEIRERVLACVKESDYQPKPFVCGAIGGVAGAMYASLVGLGASGTGVTGLFGLLLCLHDPLISICVATPLAIPNLISDIRPSLGLVPALVCQISHILRGIMVPVIQSTTGKKIVNMEE